MTDETEAFAHNPPADFDPSDGQDVSAESETVHSAQTSLGGWLRRLFSRWGEADSAARLEDLNQMVECQPQAAVNYLFRGELYLKNANYENAAADFRRASDLAAEEFDRADWGLVAQTLRDRALAGLQQAERRLNIRQAQAGSGDSLPPAEVS